METIIKKSACKRNSPGISIKRTLVFAVLMTVLFATPAMSGAGSTVAVTGGDPELGSLTGKAVSSDGLEIAWEKYDSALGSDSAPTTRSRPGDDPAPILVFVHGWCCDRTYWRNQVEGLSGDFTIVTLDLGGHGQSGIEREEWTIGLFSADVVAVVEALDLEKVILVGHSMGGPVIAGAVPLLGEKVAGIIGVDTYQGLGTKYSPEQATAATQPFRSDFKSVAGMVVRSMFREDADGELVEAIVEDMSSAPPEVAIGALTNTLLIDPMSLYGELGVPVIAINSDKYPTDIEAARSLLPQFELKLVEGRGHFLMLEDPAGFNAILAATAREIAGKQ